MDKTPTSFPSLPSIPCPIRGADRSKAGLIQPPASTQRHLALDFRCTGTVVEPQGIN